MFFSCFMFCKKSFDVCLFQSRSERRKVRNRARHIVFYLWEFITLDMMILRLAHLRHTIVEHVSKLLSASCRLEVKSNSSIFICFSTSDQFVHSVLERLISFENEVHLLLHFTCRGKS